MRAQILFLSKYYNPNSANWGMHYLQQMCELSPFVLVSVEPIPSLVDTEMYHASA